MVQNVILRRKHMKKRFAFLLPLVMVLALALPVLAAEAEDVTGDWYLLEQRYVLNDEIASSTSPFSMELFITLTLNEDGTAVFAESESLEEEPVITECPWTLEDGNVVITREGQELVFEQKNGQLLYCTDLVGSHFLVFDRQSPADTYVLPAQVEITDEEELFGTWQTVAVLKDGEVMPPDVFGVGTIRFTIEKDKYTREGLSEDMDVRYEIQDGLLQLTMDGNPFMRPHFLYDNGWLGTESGIPVYTEDGEMEIDENGVVVTEPATFFFEKVAE